MIHIRKILNTVLLLCVLSTILQPMMSADENKTVLLAILARNKAHTLPKYLNCIENLEYNKKDITVYIHTNNNSDDTIKILSDWVEKNKNLYKEIVFDHYDLENIQSTKPHEWNPERFKVLAQIRNKSIQKTQEHGCDYYFVVDCDNFIIPSTLKDLVSKDKPIIAPLLRSIPEPNDLYTNFFYNAAENGYFKDHPLHLKIRDYSIVGTFKVDVVYCTYLINSKYLDKLNYIDCTNDYEFIIFSRHARKNQVDQYICNEKDYGTQLHFHKQLSLEEEKDRFQAMELAAIL